MDKNLERTTEGNIAETVRDLMISHAGFAIETATRGDDKSTPFAVVPCGKEIKSLKPLLDEYRVAPERRKGRAIHFSLDSLVEHVNRFKDADSVLFADPNYKLDDKGNLTRSPHILGVIDYHRAGYTGDPRFGQHTAYYQFPLSEEWKKWAGRDGVVFENQEEFANFIESNLDNVMFYESGSSEKVEEFIKLHGAKFASPARLMEVARGLAIHASNKVTQKINTNTGETTLHYEEEHNAAGGENVTIPNMFMIAIPVFLNGPIFSLIVRLRYRLNGGRVRWHFELFRKEKVFETAFSEACAEAKEKTGLPLFQGSPENHNNGV